MSTDRNGRAAAIAATFNRTLRTTKEMPLAVERVVSLRIVRDLLSKMKAESLFRLDNLPAVEGELDLIEAECRAAGLFEQFADLSRAERRRLHKLTEAR